jgi:hypothetical protein
MKYDFRALVARFRSSATTILVIVLLLFPSSTSVLCIAPGNHVAIEDINALCCASFISVPSECQPDSEFDWCANCRNCLDSFLTPNGEEAISQTKNLAASILIDDGYPENLISTHISVSLCRSGSNASTDALIPLSSSVPLRC